MPAPDFDAAKLESRIRRIARRLAPNPDDVEDLVSEGLLAAYRAAPSYVPGELSLQSFLLRRALWRMRDFLRKEGKHRHSELSGDKTGQKLGTRSDRRRRLVVHISEWDYRVLEDCAKAAGGGVTPQDVARAAIRMLALLREDNAGNW